MTLKFECLITKRNLWLYRNCVEKIVLSFPSKFFECSEKMEVGPSRARTCDIRVISTAL